MYAGTNVFFIMFLYKVNKKIIILYNKSAKPRLSTYLHAEFIHTPKQNLQSLKVQF